MKKFTLIIGALLLSASLPLVAQKNLTNKLIWEGPEFSGDFFAGLNSMNDGLHYSLSEESDAFGTQIVKSRRDFYGKGHLWQYRQID